MRLAAIILAALPSTAHAVDVTCDPNDAARCATPLSLGEPAPFAGELLTIPLALALGQAVDHCQQQAAIDLQDAHDTAAAEIQAERHERYLEAEAGRAREEALKHALDDASPWYAAPPLVAAASALATAALLGLAAWGAGQLR